MKKLLLAITFLTRLPLPIPKNITVEDIGRSTPFFPLVGLLIGLILICLDELLSYLWPPLAVDAVLVVSLIVITGGLHFDGLMDTCDGIFSGRDRDRMLEIMRDSRVGAFGVLGAVCLLMLKLAFLNAIHGSYRWAALLLFPMLGRWSMVWAIALFPYARTTPGLGRPFTEFAKKRHIIWASLPVFAIAVILDVGLSHPASGMRHLMSIVVVGSATWLLAKWLSHKLGGLTGDNYGAICEVMETLSLMMMCVT